MNAGEKFDEVDLMDELMFIDWYNEAADPTQAEELQRRGFVVPGECPGGLVLTDAGGAALDEWLGL